MVQWGELFGKSESGIQVISVRITHVQVAWKAPGELPQAPGLWDQGQEMLLGQADISSTLTLYCWYTGDSAGIFMVVQDRIQVTLFSAFTSESYSIARGISPLFKVVHYKHTWHVSILSQNIKFFFIIQDILLLLFLHSAGSIREQE